MTSAERAEMRRRWTSGDFGADAAAGVRLLDELDIVAWRLRELHRALRDARPYVFNRTTTTGADTWREQTARATLSCVDAALSEHAPEP